MTILDTTRRVFSSLRFRNFQLYFASQIISFSGTWMQMIAQSWLVLEITGSGTAVGTVMAAQFTPILLFGPLGGMVADRSDNRRVLAATNSVAGALALLLGILTLSGSVELWMVYAIAAGFGCVTAVDSPSRQTFVMEMVGPEDISNAVTLVSVGVNAARITGPAVGGVLIATVGIGEVFVVNAGSYAVVLVALAFIRRDELHPTQRSIRGPGQLREGFVYVWRTPVLRSTVVMLAVVGTFAFEFPTTLPLLSEFTFQRGATGFAVMTSLMGLGAVTGGLAIAASGPPTPGRLVAVIVLLGASITVAAVLPSIELVYVVMPLIGAASLGIIALSNAMMQLNSTPELRGRVMAFFSMAIAGTTPLGGPFVGWIGEHVGPRAALLVGGISALVTAAVFRLTLGRNAPLEEGRSGRERLAFRGATDPIH